jgi:hypothetical protein
MLNGGHLTAVLSRLEPQWRKRGQRCRPGGDQELRLGVRPGVTKFEVGIEHGYSDHDRSGCIDQGAPDEMPDPVGVKVSIEYAAAVTHQAFQVE